MLRDEILNMKAGRELDALVAEKVMDWKWDGFKGGYQRLYVNDGECQRYGAIRDSKGTEYTNRLPEYSTDMGAAWEVVEYFTNKGWCPGLLFDDNGHWALSFEGTQSVAFGDDPVDVSTAFFITKDLWCDTAPLAICRAVLLTVSE